jgi:hypothetical protein
MMSHASRLPFSLHPLMAEAKRRMRQRRLLLAVSLLVIVGAAVATALAVQASSPSATRPIGRAFVKQPSTEAGGRPVQGLGPTTEVRFIPSARFAIGIVLTNDASQPVTLTDARAVLPRDPALRQIGTRLVAFNPVCRTPSCPAPGFLESRRYGTARPTALQVAPGTSAGVQLSFRLDGCNRAPRVSSQAVRQIDITYRNSAGATMRQRLRLGYSALSIAPSGTCTK